MPSLRAERSDPGAPAGCSSLSLLAMTRTAESHPLARSGRWLSSGCGRRPRSGPSLTVSRSTSRASSRSPHGSSTRLSCAAPRSRSSPPVSAKASKPNPDRAPPPCRRAAAADASARGSGWRSRREATATLPSTRIAGQRQPPRAKLPFLQLTTRPGSAARAPGSPLRMGRRLLQPSSARGGGSTGAAVSGSGLRPSIRSSASTRLSASRNRRASASRGSPANAPMVFRPSRSSVRTVSGVEPQRRDVQRREFGSASLARLQRRMNRASAQAAAAVGAIATRARQAEPRESARSISRTNPASPPNRCATPRHVEPQPVAPSTSTNGDQRARPARQPLDQRRIARRIGRHRDQSRDRAPGHRSAARRAARRAPPPLVVTAWIISPCVPSTVRATGASGADSRSIFAQRSIARCGNQMEAIRVMRDPPAARRQTRARGTARHPTPAVPALAGRADWPATARSRSASASAPRSNSQCRRAAPASTARRCRSAATASRRVAVKSSAPGRPTIRRSRRESAAHLTPSSIAHSASRASRASTWMRSSRGSPGGWIRPLSRIAIRSWTHSKGLPASSCASRNPAQPPSRGCAANSSDRVGWRAGGRASASARPTPLAGSRVSAGRTRGDTPPATRERPVATQLTTLLFYFCSYTASQAAEVNRATRLALQARRDGRWPSFVEERRDLARPRRAQRRGATRRSPCGCSRSRPPCRARRRGRARRAARRSRRAATRGRASAPAACRLIRGIGGSSTVWPATHS